MMAKVVLSRFSFVMIKIHRLIQIRRRVTDPISRAWDVKKDLQKLRKIVLMMQPHIFYAEGKQSTSKTVQLWLKRLRSIARDAKFVLDDFERTVLRQEVENRKRDKENRKRERDKVRNSFSKKIKNVSASLEGAYRKADRIGLPPVQLNMTSADHKEDRLTDPFVDESETVGREVEVSQVVNMLISSDYKKDLPVIAIVGMSVVAINNALERYQELDPTFSGTREYRLLADLASAIDEEDVAKFTEGI